MPPRRARPKPSAVPSPSDGRPDNSIVDILRSTLAYVEAGVQRVPGGSGPWLLTGLRQLVASAEAGRVGLLPVEAVKTPPPSPADGARRTLLARPWRYNGNWIILPSEHDGQGVRLAHVLSMDVARLIVEAVNQHDALRERAEVAEKALAQERRWHDRDHRIREKAMTRFEEEQDRAEAAEAALRTHEAVWEHAEGCMAGCDPDADDWCEVARDLSREAAVLRRKVLAAAPKPARKGGR